MAVVGIVTYVPDGRLPVVRSYISAIALQWQANYTILATGNPFVIRENTFGGYQTHIKLKPEFYAWSSNVYTLDWIFEDWYVTAPGGSPIIPGQPVQFGISTQSNGIPCIYGVWTPSSAPYIFFSLPPAPPDYWLQLPT
jgi:hypothetical protein